MLKDAFFNVYTKFKLHFYQEIFSRFQPFRLWAVPR